MNAYQYVDWDLAFMEAIREDWAKIRAKQSFAQQAADIARTTVPGKQERDPALVKLDNDAKITAPPPTHILERFKQLRKEA
jgi:hypothetical protein